MKSPQQISDLPMRKRELALQACAKATEKRKKATQVVSEADAQPIKKLKAPVKGKPKNIVRSAKPAVKKAKTKEVEKKKSGDEVDLATSSQAKIQGKRVEIEVEKGVPRKAKACSKESESKEVVAAAKSKGKGKGKEVEIEKNEPAPKEGQAVEEFFEKLQGMKFEQGFFSDEVVLKKMGLYEDVASVFENMGLGKFMMMKEVAHKDLTCQFLSTVEARFYKKEHKRAASKGYGEIRFKINNMVHHVSFREICEIFGFKEDDTCGEQYFDYPRGELQRFWESIASESYEPGTCKYTSIRSPVLKYVHMALTRTLFTRVEYNKVSKDEIELLGVGVKPFLKTLIDGAEFIGTKHKPSLATFLARHFLFYKDWALETTGKRASLAIGWMITPILRSKGIKLPEENKKWKLIDESYLSRAQFFKGMVGTGFAYNLKLTDAEMAQVTLPNISLTKFDEPANIFFTPPKDSLYNTITSAPIEAYRGKKQSSGKNVPSAQIGEPHDGPPQDSSPTTMFGGQRYHFDPYDGIMPSASTSHAHHHIRLLQRWCKWQDRTMKKMARKYKDLEKTVKGMGKKIKELTRNGGASSSSPQEQGIGGWEMGNDMISGKEMVLYEEGRCSMAYQETEGKRRAMRSPSPCSSNPSLSLGSSSSSPSI